MTTEEANTIYNHVSNITEIKCYTLGKSPNNLDYVINIFGVNGINLSYFIAKIYHKHPEEVSKDIEHIENITGIKVNQIN